MLDFERISEYLKTPMAAPLHARLRSAIQAQLVDGTVKPGETLPSERALKEQLGISRATIRQAIKSLIDESYLKSIVGSGTYVLDPQQRSPQNPLIGIIIPESNYSVYYPELASSLSFGLRNAGYRVDTSIHNDRYETLTQVIVSLLSQQAKAVVFVAPNQDTDADEVINRLHSHGVLTMLLTRYLKGFKEVDYIGADNRLIGMEATQHLIRLGHKNILHIAASSTSTALDRSTGYIQAMEDAGLTPQIYVAPDERGTLPLEIMTYVMKIELEQLWIQVARKDITGVFCFNDQIASWLQKEIRQFNLAIPADLSVISVDNMPYAGFFDAPLTTFALPGEEIGRQAAGLLLRRLTGEALPPQRILLPARLIHRLSTSEPRRKIIPWRS